MNTFAVIVLLATVGCSFAYLEKCSTEADCGQDQCCVFGKRCGPKLPVHSTCYFSSKTGCGCVSGSSCNVTFQWSVLGRTFYVRQCVRDAESAAPIELNDAPEDEAERARRFLIRGCSSETVAADCGNNRCCLGGRYCAPLIPKYLPCNLKDSHKCPCAAGLECKLTKSLTIPGVGVTLNLKQCMPVDESVKFEVAEMTEN